MGFRHKDTFTTDFVWTPLQQQACSRCFLSTGLKTKQQRRSVSWKGLRLRLKGKPLRPRSLLLWNMVSIMWPTLLSRFWFTFVIQRDPFIAISFIGCFYSKWQLFECIFLAEQSTISSYCAWCGPYRVGCLASCIMQEDGNPILHCQGKISLGIGNCALYLYFLKSLFRSRALDPLLIYIIFMTDCSQENCLCFVLDHSQERR